MTKLHETLRRRLCRVSFCLLCVLPTAGVLGYCASRKLPAHVRQCEQELNELFGLRAKLAAVRYPRPGVALFEGLELAEAETGETVLRCATLELETIDGRVVLSAVQPEIESARLALLWELLVRRLRHELAIEGESRLTPCQLKLRTPRGVQLYEDLEGSIEPADEGEAVELRFRPAGADDSQPSSSQPVSFRVVRDRSKGAPETRLSFDTNGGEVPVSIFAPLADVEGWLGSDSRFDGSFWVDEAADGWQADVTGHLTGVDLQSLIGDHFPHQLSGTAKIVIDQALFHRGRLSEGSGSLTAGPGTIGTSLIDAAVESLECEPGKFDWSKPVTPFDELAFRFQVSAGGLSLAGKCKSAEPRRPLLVGANRRVLLGSPEEGLLSPVISVVRMLVPRSELQVPATRETTALLQVLPIPPIVEPKDVGE